MEKNNIKENSLDKNIRFTSALIANTIHHDPEYISRLDEDVQLFCNKLVKEYTDDIEILQTQI